MNTVLQVFDHYLDLLVSSLSSIMTEYKMRKWANKEKGLMIWEISVIVFSIILATIIVSQFDDPIIRVEIRPEFVDLEALLNLLPNSFKFIVSIFKGIGHLFELFGNFLKSISLTLSYYLGPIWDILIFIPCKIFEFIHFILICLASILTALCNFFTNFFSKLSFYISYPFKFIFDLLKGIFNFIFKLPVVSHIINFLNILFQDIIILFTSFLVCIMKTFEFIIGLFEWFDLDKIWVYLKDFKLFRFIIEIPRFIYNIIYQIFIQIFKGISFVLRILHLYNFFAIIFGTLYNMLLRVSLFIVNILVHLFVFLHNILLYIPLSCNWLIRHLKNIQIKIIPLDFMKGFFTFVLNAIKWIFLFPVYIIRRFIGFFYYLLTSLSFDGLRNWWDSLCKDQPGGCGQSMTKLTEEVVNLRGTVEKLIVELNKKYQQ